jgi:benzoyl-CoA 2,3-dioxygenase component B
VGIYASVHFTPQGELISADEWTRRRDEWLPSTADLAYVQSLMRPVYECGKIANWIAPAKGLASKPWDFEYVRID